MLAPERREKIISIVNQDGFIKINEIVNEFKITPLTAWRDLKKLDELGLVRKVHGGAAKITVNSVPEPTFEQRRYSAYKEKRAIAKYAAKNLVKDDDTIFLGPGSTLIHIITYLRQKNLTLITSGLNAMMYAAKNAPHINLISSGGILRYPAMAFEGEEAENYFNSKNADIVFLSATGITKDGITDPHPWDAKLKRVMCKNAKKIVFLMDSSKFGKISMVETTSLDEIDLLLTDSKITSKFRSELDTNGVIYKIIKNL